MIKFREFITEYSTVEKARNLGLEYIGFGRYKAKDGKLYLVKHNSLVPFERGGDRFAHMAARYEKAIADTQELRNTIADFEKKGHPMQFAKGLVTQQNMFNKAISRRLVKWRDYHYLKSTASGEDIRNLQAVKWPHVRAWFDGWYMGNKDASEVTKSFEAIQKVFPNHDMTLYRIVSRRKDDSKEGFGPKPLQSWCLTKQAAMNFYLDEYRGGNTMTTDSEGHMFVVDKTKTHDFELVQAKIPGDMIMWTPHTLTRLEGFFDWQEDTAPNDPILPDRVKERLDDYRYQQEVIVNMTKPSRVQVLDRKPAADEDDSDKYQDAGTNDPSDGNGVRPWDHYLKLDKAQEVANHLKFDPDNVFIKDGDSEFEVAGQKYHLAGSAHLAEGTIDIYPNQVTLESLPGTMAHEIMHHKWHKVYTTYVQEMETFQRYQRMDTKPSLKDYPTYAAIRPFMNTKIADKLREEDGATKYSESYWKQYEASPTMEALKSALHETLAELARLDYETKGTYFDRVIRLRKGPWRKFYDAVNKSYERLSK